MSLNTHDGSCMYAINISMVPHNYHQQKHQLTVSIFLPFTNGSVMGFISLEMSFGGDSGSLEVKVWNFLRQVLMRVAPCNAS